MILRLLKRSFSNQKKAMALMIASVAVGTAMAASLMTISFEISGKVSKELRAFGANIQIEPKVEGLADISGQRRYLRQEDVIKAKTIFWRHNIIGIAPFLQTKARIRLNDVTEIDVVGSWYEKELPLPGESGNFIAGIRTVFPWWNINGQWPDAPDRIVIGASLSDRLKVKENDYLVIDDRKFMISGVLETGGKEDDKIFMDLKTLQDLKDMKDKISGVSVSALTTPMDEFAYKDPKTMSKTEYEKWYCTGYVTSISKQLEEVFQGSRAKPVWQVAEAEGKILEKLRLLIYFLSLVAIIASALGVSTTMIMSLLRRIEEIGLMKAIGADSNRLIYIFLSEGLVIGFIGGIAGYALSFGIVKHIGLQVFNAGLEQRGMLLPVALGSAILISIIGILLPIKRALKIKPGIVLKGAE